MATAQSIGNRIRHARQNQGVSLRRVAQELGVSPSLISQIETGKTHPSVATLYALANFLGVSADELLGINAIGQTAPIAGRPSFLVDAIGQGSGGSDKAEVQRAADNPAIEMETGVRWEKLASGPDRSVDNILVTYEVGASSSGTGKLMRHSGYEYAYILEGELTLFLEFETYVLGPGDSLQFESARPHMYANNGATLARGVWFVMGRNSGGAQPGQHSGVNVRSAARAVEVLGRIDLLEEDS